MLDITNQMQVENTMRYSLVSFYSKHTKIISIDKDVEKSQLLSLAGQKKKGK